MNLFEISKDLLEFEQLMTDCDGEIPNEEIERQLDAWFADITVAKEIKLDNYAALIKQIDARVKVRTEEKKRISALIEVDENASKRLKERLKWFFERHQLSKQETRRFKIALQNNGGVLPVTLTDDAIKHPEELPEEYRRVVFEPDLDAIRETLEKGEELEFASLGQRGQHIRIK